MLYSSNSRDSFTFSVIIPTRNERKDILTTLDRCLELSPPPIEILVVDDSTDGTPQIVSQYAERGVQLIHRTENRNGCCGARNVGLSEARGDIVVFFNADDRPDADFLERLSKIYESGADYVIVKSEVMNKSSIWGKFTNSHSEYWLRKSPNMEWSEGFSCKRAVALNVHGFPGDFPVPFCRDWMLGDTLNKAGYKKIVDLSITMLHRTPDNLSEYWQNQKWRGTFAPLHYYYFHEWPFPFVMGRELLKLIRTFFYLLLVFPQIIEAIRYVKYTERKYLDIPSLWFVRNIQMIASTAGNFVGLISLLKAI